MIRTEGIYKNKRKLDVFVSSVCVMSYLFSILLLFLMIKTNNTPLVAVVWAVLTRLFEDVYVIYSNKKRK